MFSLLIVRSLVRLHVRQKSMPFGQTFWVDISWDSDEVNLGR